MFNLIYGRKNEPKQFWRKFRAGLKKEYHYMIILH